MESGSLRDSDGAVMYRALTRIYWNDEALPEILPTVQVASKQGAVDRSRFQLFRDISRMVWRHSEPDHAWSPPACPSVGPGQ